MREWTIGAHGWCATTFCACWYVFGCVGCGELKKYTKKRGSSQLGVQTLSGKVSRGSCHQLHWDVSGKARGNLGCKVAAASSPLSPVGGLLLHLGLGSNPTTPVWVQYHHHHHHHGRPWHQADYIPPGQVGNILPILLQSNNPLLTCTLRKYEVGDGHAMKCLPWIMHIQLAHVYLRQMQKTTMGSTVLLTASTMVQVTIELGRIKWVLEDSGEDQIFARTSPLLIYGWWAKTPNYFQNCCFCLACSLHWPLFAPGW